MGLFKDLFLQSYKTKHDVLEIIVIILSSESKDGTLPSDLAIPLKTISEWRGNSVDNITALRYLLATGYLKHEKVDSVQGALLLTKGMDAFNSNYFLTEYKSQLRLRNNNRWMIFLTGILAVGVIYSIYRDTLKESALSEDIIRRLESLESKILDSHKTSTYQYRSKTNDTITVLKTNP